MRQLSELDVLIVDCQTTGATPALGAVLEMGWCVLRPGDPDPDHHQAHWIALPEGHGVSSQVRRITGYDERLVQDALSPAAAWERLRACTNGASPAPAAIHFARFELAFLRDWASRFEPEREFPLDVVCVHAIACRLYPELPRRSLRALAGYLGHGLDLARRSLGHVEATAFVWRKLVGELEQRGIRSWDELRDWLATPHSVARPKRHSYPIAKTRYRTLPDSPGVYRFVRSNGDLLYVGKAASLRKRVASHFTARSKREHSVEMLTQVHDVQFTVTASALEAALLENESIKTLAPPYNVQLVPQSSEVWFARADFSDASPDPGDGHVLGPLPSPWSVSSLRALVALRAGEPATRSRRARSVGAADRWAPDEAVFASGLSRFTERRLPSVTTDPRREVLGAARQIWNELRAATAEEETPLDEADTETAAPVWDPDRVARHLERNLAQSYQLLGRARWLCRLQDSEIVYSEPGSPRARRLVVRDGRVVDARDETPDERPTSTFAASSLEQRQRAFDRAMYDRLRVLTTELKRIRRDGGEVTVFVGRGRPVRGKLLDAVLRWV